MSRVDPFKATRYNPEKVEDPAKVVAPPYDVIGPDQQDDLYQRSPYNIIRLILGKEQPNDNDEDNKYQRAASFLREWKSEGVLRDDSSPAFYVYQQEFQTPDGKWRVRNGFFAAIRVEDPEKGRIRAHEHTFAGPKADRLKLLRATNCNLSPIFCLYSDPEKESDEMLDAVMREKAPAVDIEDDNNVRHRLWPVDDAAMNRKLSESLNERDFMIADGHHRYETAVRYAQEMEQALGADSEELQPYRYTLAFLTNTEQEGLLILPTHRVLSSQLGEDVNIEKVASELARYFDMEQLKVDLGAPEEEGRRLCAQLEKEGKGTNAFTMVLPDGRAYFMRKKADADLGSAMPGEVSKPIAKLDVSVLHQYIIPRVWIGNPDVELDDTDITYAKDASAALRMLNAPAKASVVFLMNGPTIEQVNEITSQRLRMPHKTTYFYPKVLSGLVLRDIEIAKKKTS